MASFLGEIKRRRVFQVAVLYIVVAWIVLQVVDVVADPLNLPEWFESVVIVLLIIGFPIALVLAWAFEITPRGILRDGEHSRADGESADPADRLKHADADSDVLPNSVAVLPFENLSPNPDHAFFAAGVHEATLNELARVGDLRVIARTSVLRYSDGQTPIAQIAADLKVQTVMEGSVQYANNRVRITAQLIDPKTGAHLWSEIYDRDFDDIFAVQTDIAMSIAAALQAKLTSRERKTLAQRPTVSAHAYALYLQAISSARLAGGIEADPQESVHFLGLLDQAIEIDPNFALAYALKAREYAYTIARPVRRTDPLTIAARDELAIKNAERALALDQTVGVAFAGLGAAHRFTRRNRDAVEAFDRAMLLNPYEPRVLRDVALFHLYRGRIDKAIEVTQTIITIDPALGYFILAVALWSRGDLEAADEIFQRVLSLSPTLFSANICYAWVHLLRGDRAEAVELLKVAEKLGVAEFGGATFLPMLAMAYHELECAEDAARIADEIESHANEYFVTGAARALIYLSVDELDRALETLTDAANAPQSGEDINEALIAFNLLPIELLERPEFVAVRRKLAVNG